MTAHISAIHVWPIVHQLVRRLDLHSMTWRHHGLGMLQGEIDETLRVHVWHPDLVRIPEGPRRIHDHRFDITSYVVVGAVTDVQIDVYDAATLQSLAEYEPGERTLSYPIGEDWKRTECWEIRHAKIQGQAAPRAGCSTATDAELLGDVLMRMGSVEKFSAGETYHLMRRAFHTTLVEDLAVTLVHRSAFDERLARVLGDAGDGKSAIQPTDPKLIEKYLNLAASRIAVRIYAEDSAKGYVGGGRHEPGGLLDPNAKDE